MKKSGEKSLEGSKFQKKVAVSLFCKYYIYSFQRQIFANIIGIKKKDSWNYDDDEEQGRKVQRK